MIRCLLWFAICTIYFVLDLSSFLDTLAKMYFIFQDNVNIMHVQSAPHRQNWRRFLRKSILMKLTIRHNTIRYEEITVSVVKISSTRSDESESFALSLQINTSDKSRFLANGRSTSSSVRNSIFFFVEGSLNWTASSLCGSKVHLIAPILHSDALWDLRHLTLYGTGSCRRHYSNQYASTRSNIQWVSYLMSRATE